MKTAISLPNRLFEEAEKTAAALGIPRSRLYTRALEEFLARYRDEEITASLNEVYTDSPGISATYAGLESLRELTKNDTW